MADILKAKDFVRVRLTRNGINLYDQAFVSNEEDFTEHTTERVVLSTNMATSQQVNLGGVAIGHRLFLEASKSVQVGLGVTPAAKWPLDDDGVLVFVGSFSHIWVRNTGTVESVLTYVVTD